MSYRALYGSILDSRRSASPFTDILSRWIDEHHGEVEWLLQFAGRVGTPVPPASREDLWELYALGRVNELLLLRFQQGYADGSDWPGPNITQEEYVAFTTRLGLKAAVLPVFSPFYHEIVSVHPASDPDQPVTLVNTRWPCFTLGPMMFSRAGVEVSAGVNVISKSLAETSTLYWAHRRKHRMTQDLAVGWGSNSQWRTEFRRDYRLGDELFCNVDGKYDLSTMDEGATDRSGLTRDDRLELLVNRCMLACTKPSHDLFPYHDRARLRFS